MSKRAVKDDEKLNLFETFSQETLDAFNEVDKDGEKLIHKVARSKNPEHLESVIKLMLKSNPKADLNPFVLTSVITGSGYDVAELLKKPKPKGISRSIRINPNRLVNELYGAPAYCPKCEMILEAQILLQSLRINDPDNVAIAVLAEFAYRSYDFEELSYEQINILGNGVESSKQTLNQCDERLAQHVAQSLDSNASTQEEDYEDPRHSIEKLNKFLTVNLSKLKEISKSNQELFALTKEPSTSLTKTLSVINFARDKIGERDAQIRHTR
jgi:hypothetical protein